MVLIRRGLNDDFPERKLRPKLLSGFRVGMEAGSAEVSLVVRPLGVLRSEKIRKEISFDVWQRSLLITQYRSQVPGSNGGVIVSREK